ncbi:MAG: hydroxyacid-oxoacid transhydrogenase [Ornithinibacter sp.]
MPHPDAQPETVFTYAAPQLVFGPGACGDIGHHLLARGARRVLVVTDEGVAGTGTPERIAEELRLAGLVVEVFDGVHVEPTDASIAAAVTAARASGPWDAFVAVGGGSSIDTAKAVNLLLTNPGELMDYVNAPVGGGRSPLNPVKPLVAVPTTTGTGSESTSICVLDVLDLHVKTGISHQTLRPVLAVIDPLVTMSQPPEVTAAAGMDILCHALESLTARPYTAFERKQPEQRVPYCGANPVSDLWAQKALSLMSSAFRRAVRDGDDAQARGDMALAATFAGFGFGNAGVHLPHANAYPIAGRVKDFRPAGYPTGEPMIPHGMAVSLTAPASLRWTFDTAPERHLAAARLLDPAAETTGDPAGLLPTVLLSIMRDVGMPAGLAAVGYGADDVPDLVEGTLRQERLLALSPREVTAEDVAGLFTASMELW